MLSLRRVSEIPGVLDVISAMLDEQPRSASPVCLQEVPLPRPEVRGTILAADDIAAIRTRYGTYTPGKHGRRPGVQQPISIKRLAREYHVSTTKILEILLAEGSPMDNNYQSEIVPANAEAALLNEEEAATYLGVTVGTIRAYLSNGTLCKKDWNGQTGLLLTDLYGYRESRSARRGRKAAQPELEEEPSTASSSPESDLTEHTSPENDSSGEVCILQGLVAYAFANIPGVLGLPRMTEVPRSWKIDASTVRGPESYRLIRNADGTFQQERWEIA